MDLDSRIDELLNEYGIASREAWEADYNPIQRCHPSANGLEVWPGWFNLFSQFSQSKTVLLHAETGLVFKSHYGNSIPDSDSGEYVGNVNLDGIDYRIRLPFYYDLGDVIAQEFIDGESDQCGEWMDDQSWRGGWCEHAYAVASASGYDDAHTGNWQYFNGEIVLFDFD